jgi:hypothetical protein
MEKERDDELMAALTAAAASCKGGGGQCCSYLGCFSVVYEQSPSISRPSKTVESGLCRKVQLAVFSAWSDPGQPPGPGPGRRDGSGGLKGVNHSCTCRCYCHFKYICTARGSTGRCVPRSVRLLLRLVGAVVGEL